MIYKCVVSATSASEEAIPHPPLPRKRGRVREGA